MSVALAEPLDLEPLDHRVVDREVDADREPAGQRGARSAPAPTRRRARRPGPGVGPVARPRRLRFVAPPARGARSCAAPAPVVVPQERTWRLTERGLAVVLVVAAALVAASVSVVALTALRVTGESYHPGSVAAAPVVAQP